MKYLYLLIVCILIISCGDQREGLPEDQRNYSAAVCNEADSLCMRDQNGCFQFYHINADTVTQRILQANEKYFGPAFATSAIRSDIYHWLHVDFFSPVRPGKLQGERDDVPADASRYTCNYRYMHGLDAFGKDVFITNNICLRKLIDTSSTYAAENVSANRGVPTYKLKFLCEFHIDITYRPKSSLNKGETEYYRETITDTVDMFTVLDASNFIYR